MITLRAASERGHSNLGWLDSRHTFSFSDYYDQNHMGFRALRVINEDRVQPGKGFGTHSHQDMEILSYVLEGAIEHKDSLGTGAIIRPGEIQRMTAGTGISHSEFNPSSIEPMHLLQIWILPEQQGLKPSYEQHAILLSSKPGELQLIASQRGRNGVTTIHQDVHVFAGVFQPGDLIKHHLSTQRHAWVQVARGAIVLNGHALRAGDGAAVSHSDLLEISATAHSELLVFDLA